MYKISPYWCCLHCIWCRVYVTVRYPFVSPSACLSRHSSVDLCCQQIPIGSCRHLHCSLGSHYVESWGTRLNTDLSGTAVLWCKKSNGSPYSITERRVPELIPVLGSQPTGDMSHKPGGRLPLLSTRPAVTPATFTRAATSVAAWWTEAQWLWAVCLRLLPDSVRLRF